MLAPPSAQAVLWSSATLTRFMCCMSSVTAPVSTDSPAAAYNACGVPKPRGVAAAQTVRRVPSHVTQHHTSMDDGKVQVWVPKSTLCCRIAAVLCGSATTATSPTFIAVTATPRQHLDPGSLCTLHGRLHLLCGDWVSHGHGVVVRELGQCLEVGRQSRGGSGGGVC